MTDNKHQSVTASDLPEGGEWLVLDVEQIEAIIEVLDQYPDPFADDEPLVCGVENPDECEACG